MKLSKDKFVAFLGNPKLWSTNGANGFVHYETLPNAKDMLIGYCVNKTAENHYNIAAFLQKDAICEFLTVLEIVDHTDDVEIIGAYENGVKLDMRDTDVINRCIGKMALQFDYINALAQDAQNIPEQNYAG